MSLDNFCRCGPAQAKETEMNFEDCAKAAREIARSQLNRSLVQYANLILEAAAKELEGRSIHGSTECAAALRGMMKSAR